MVIGKYIRLSMSDKDLMKKENKTESESISHQRDLIQRYINAHDDLKECEVREFYDDGYTGTNFNRPSFERLLDQIKSGEINCVIVKDFSRFGRDYIELGDYLERIFPFLGVRFISVNDGYDSNDYKGTTGGLDVVLKNIVYDFYSKDLSVKMTTAKTEKLKRGVYIGGHAPYGLMRDPEDKHKLAIDPEAAAVVREIFDMAISGCRMVDIIRTLNERGIETPAQYYQRKHPDDNKFRDVSDMACWNNCAVKYILKREMYYGAVVGHKRQSIGRGWKHSRKTPKDEQIIVEGMHPAIVTKEEFLEAQKVFKKGPEKKKHHDKTYPLWKKVACGVCGRAMWTHWKPTKDGGDRYFYCPHAADQVVQEGCCKKWFREDELTAVVWESVKGVLDAATDAKKRFLEQQSISNRDNAVMAKKLTELQKEKAGYEGERFTNMDQFMAGNLEKEVFLSRRAELTQKMERLDADISNLEAKLHEAEITREDGTQAALETFDSFAGAEGLDQKMVDAMIEKVLVYDPEHIEIKWSFPDEVICWLSEE